MLLALAIGLLVVSAAAIAAVLRLSLTGALLAAYLVASAEIVVLAQALSPFHGVRPRDFLVAQTVVAVATTALWAGLGAPFPALPGVEVRALRRHPVLLVFAAVVAAALAFEAVLVATAVPNNWDSMTYHLSRAAGWYQHGALVHLAAHTERENVFPLNAEIQSLFTMLFVQTDRFAAAPQYVSELALIVGIFGVGRRLGFERSASAFASLLFATFSEVVMQATTTQNDLVVSACLVAGLYFLLGPTRRELGLAGIAAGLAVGAKLTAVFAIPALVLVALFVLPRRRFAEFAIATAVAVGVVGSPTYIANILDYGTPLGAPSVRRPYESKHSVAGSIATFGRVLYRFIDLSGVKSGATGGLQHGSPSLYDPVRIQPEAASGPPQKSSFFRLNRRANEDISYFGPLGALLILPIVAGYLAAWASVGPHVRAGSSRLLYRCSLRRSPLRIATTHGWAASSSFPSRSPQPSSLGRTSRDDSDPSWRHWASRSCALR